MRIQYSDIRESIHKEAINKKIKDLIQRGYHVNEEFEIDGVHVDLFAERGNERIIYEFKTKKKSINKTTYEKLQRIAKNNNAKFKIIYITPPNISGQIQFDDLEEILMDDLRKKSDIVKGIDGVTDIWIDKIDIKRSRIYVSGECLAEVSRDEMAYGLRFDINLGMDLRVEKSD